MSTIKINVYRDGSTWFGARWIDDEYDGCDALGISDGVSEQQAIEHARTMPLNTSGERIVTKVEDMDSANGRFPS